MLKYETAYLSYKSINNSKLIELKNQLFKAAIRYANLRAEWSFMDTEQKAENDFERTAAHNRFIDACNIMARNMRTANEDTSWAEILKNDRKVIGDFACYLLAFMGLQNR